MLHQTAARSSKNIVMNNASKEYLVTMAPPSKADSPVMKLTPPVHKDHFLVEFSLLVSSE